jgi:epoxyqueuosine reductase
MKVSAARLIQLAKEHGFELAGLTPALPLADHAIHMDWVERGRAAGMGYLTDHRAQVRSDPRLLLPSARSMLCLGKLYNTPGPARQAGRGWISRYAWGARDYHDVMREGLESLAAAIRAEFACEYRVCVDTAPLLERSYARQAGLGWIGKNTCLIHQGQGSWFFLGEILFSFETDQYQQAPPDRCGSCTRCIDACPTAAIIPAPHGWELDSQLCISYWTIEAKEAAPAELQRAFGEHLFGCDICQDVCPWNRRAPFTSEPAFQPRNASPALDELEAIDEAQFRARFRQTPLWRSKYAGFRRNLKIALENRSRE